MEKQSKSENLKRTSEIMHILTKHDIISGITPEKLVAILGDLGPTFIKFGQILSMRSDILPDEYCKSLSTLRTNINPLDFETVKNIIETEFAKELDEIFSSFDDKPLGSASIAQVHKAKFLNQDVVVKIQRPGIYETMSKDIILLKKAIRIIKKTNFFDLEIDLDLILNEMWEVAKQEMDFTIETSNLALFQKNSVDIKYITSPKVYPEYATSKVFVMEYIDGFFINETSLLKENGYDLEEIAKKIANNYVKQIIDDGFFHADPHSGNIKIFDGKIVWIDLGMMGHLTDSDKELLTEIIKSIDNKDINGLSNAVLALGTPSGEVDLISLNNDLEVLLLKFGTQSLNKIDINSFYNDFTNIIKKYKIPMRKGLSTLGRGLITLQSTILNLSEEISFMDILTNYLSNNIFKDFDIEKNLKSTLKNSFNSFTKLLDMPAQISNSLKMFERGMSKMKMDLDFSENMSLDLNKMIDKIIKSVIISALLIGSSLICTTDMNPKILNIPALGFFGFLIAFILGIDIIFEIRKDKK